MNDLERDLRDLLEDEARLAPPAHDARVAIRRTRRRQIATVAAATLGVAALLVGGVAGLRWIGDPDRTVPAGETATTMMNGISITAPEAWHVIDPDEAGLNGAGTAPDLPRLVLAMAPTDPGDAFGCPGLAKGAAPTFLMTVQEQPLALAGRASAAWPVALAPPIAADASETGCYPGWDFLGAEWTAEGRTFRARVGFAPDADDEEREALLAAFSSMTFEPQAEGSSAVVLPKGSAGGEGWELIASGQGAGLDLTLQGETFGAGSSYLGQPPEVLHLVDHVFGDGSRADRVVFAAVPEEVVRVVAIDAALTPMDIDVLDVPDGIDDRLNAFVVTIASDQIVAFEAYDARGRLVASAEALEPVGPTNELDIVWSRLFRAQQTVSTYAANQGSFRGFDAAAAARIDPGVGGDPGIRWNDGTLRDGEVSIRDVAAESLVLVSATSLGDPFCVGAILDNADGLDFFYGTQDAATLEDCQGGW
jgi:hypothetical protein